MVINPVNNPAFIAHQDLILNKLQRRKTEEGFTIRIKNTAITTKTVSLFDNLKACGTSSDQANTDTYVTCDYQGGIANFRKYVSDHNISITEILYAPTSPSQFNQKLKYFIGGPSGDVIPKSLQTAVVKAQNSNQANNDVQKITTAMVLAGDMDLCLDVLAGEDLSLTFTILEIERSL